MSVLRKADIYRYLVFIVLLIAAPSSPTLAQYAQKVIVASSDPAPGTDGAIFNTTSYSPPVSIGISIAGDVLFTGMLEDGVGDATPENMNGA